MSQKATLWILNNEMLFTVNLEELFLSIQTMEINIRIEEFACKLTYASTFLRRVFTTSSAQKCT